MQTSKENALTKPLTICLMAAVSCFLWGSAPSAIKTGYRLFQISSDETWRIVLFAGMRFTLAGLLIMLFFGVKERKLLLPKKTSWGKVLAVSFFQTAGQYFCYYIGTAHASGVNCSILAGASSLWAILFACFLFRQEKMTVGKLAGCLLGFGGILAMNSSGAGGQVSFLGEGMVLLSGIFSATAAGLVKIFTKDESAVAITAWQFFIGGLVMCFVSLMLGARVSIPSFGGLMILLYLGFVSAVAYSIWTTLIKHNPVSSVTIYGFMNPLFGLLLSALVLGETKQAFNIHSLIALLLVCAGIVVVNRFGSPRKNQKSREAANKG